MWCGLLLVGFLATVAQAFRPAPIRWDGRLGKNLFLAPTVPLGGIVTPQGPQGLTLKELFDSTVPYFIANHDGTISCRDNYMRWCLEASDTERGYVVRVNHCMGTPTQKWRWLPRGPIQLEGTNQCIHVNENDGLSTISAELIECASKATDTWMFEDTVPAPARSSLESLPFSISSIGAAAMIAALGLGAWMWRLGIVAASKGSAPLKRERGGVCLSEPVAVRSSGITMSGRSFVPAATEASSFASKIKGKMILAPLTDCGNPPFRRLCADFGCEASMGEMILARSLLKGDAIERHRLHRTSNEVFFGVQIATSDVSEGIAAARIAAEHGADFIDLNCGCPIRSITRSGIGSALLREPDKLASLVRGIVQGSPLPVTVKIRKAAEGHQINVQEVAEKVRDAGAAAVTVHGRTAEERYAKAADWESIRQVVADGAKVGSTVPVVGNGDILTWYEARQRINHSGADAVMVGRGALIKPWIFDEFKRNRSWEPTAHERIEIYHRLACYCKEYFAETPAPEIKAQHFLKMNLRYLAQYRPLPAEKYSGKALETPLMQTVEGIQMGDSPLENLLTSPESYIHEMLAETLCNSTTSADAIRKVSALAEGDARIAMLKAQQVASKPLDAAEIAEWEHKLRSERTRRLGSRHKNGYGKSKKTARTPEEIAIIRAVRAEKRRKFDLPPHVNGPSRVS